MTADWQHCRTCQAVTSGAWDEQGTAWTCTPCGTRHLFADYDNDPETP